MDSYYKQWKKVLDEFRDDVEKDLKEIRRHKAEMQQMKLEVIDKINQGKYIRDDKRIIISAPDIIIGNVDANGTLMTTGTSSVTIRANYIQEEGVGTNLEGGGGCIVNRASRIQNVCVDPGIDGAEQVVPENSEFITQARSVVLQSDDVVGHFPYGATTTTGSGIFLRADKHVSIEAALPGDKRKEMLNDLVTNLKEQKGKIQTDADKQKAYVDELMGEMDKLMSGDDKLNEDNSAIRSNYIDIRDLNRKIESLSTSFCVALRDCERSLSLLAETNRQITCLEEQKKQIEEFSDKYKTESTGASVSIYAERMDVLSMDGDGELRTNPEAGVGIIAKNVHIQSLQSDNALMEESSVNILSQAINLSTANPKIEMDKEKKEITSAEYPATGDVRITSKNITLESVDYEWKDKKIEEKALTEKGSIRMRTESIDVSTTDTEGKATGSININSKVLELKSMDVDKEKRTDKELTEGSTMLLLSEKIYAGSRDKDTKSQSVQIVSDKVGVFADTTAEMQQGEGKAVVQMDGGSVAVSGDKAELYGETTMNGKTTFKAETVTGKATIDNIEIKTSFKTPCTTEGIAVPAPPSTAKLSTKLKEEEAPKQDPA